MYPLLNKTANLCIYRLILLKVSVRAEPIKSYHTMNIKITKQAGQDLDLSTLFNKQVLSKSVQKRRSIQDASIAESIKLIAKAAKEVDKLVLDLRSNEPLSNLDDLELIGVAKLAIDEKKARVLKANESNRRIRQLNKIKKHEQDLKNIVNCLF